MSEHSSHLAAELTADEQADKQIIKQLTVCILTMMGVAVVIMATANSIA